MRIHVIGECESAKVLRGYLQHPRVGYAVGERFCDFIVELIENPGRSCLPIVFDSVDSELERQILSHVSILTAKPVTIDRRGGVVHSDREIRIEFAPEDRAAVEKGVFRGILDVTRHSQPKWWHLRRRWRIRQIMKAIGLVVLLSVLGHAQGTQPGTQDVNLQQVQGGTVFWDAVNNAIRVNIVGGGGTGGGPADVGATTAASETDTGRQKVTTALRLLDTSQTAGSQLVAANGDQINGLWVNCKNGCGSSSFADNSAFTAGTTAISNVGGFYTTSPSAVSSGVAAALRITAWRALHINLRDSSGNELLGQKAMAASVPVALASDQPAISVTQSGTWTNTVTQAAGANLHVNVDSAPTTAVTGTFFQSTQPVSIADGSSATLGAKADAKSTATDTTAISVMSVLKEISALEQAPASRAVTNAGTFAVQSTLQTGSAQIGHLEANQSTNVAQVAGTATDTNSGAKSAGTLRVVLATDQPQLTNKLLVTPDSVALPANQSVNVNQLAGTATDTNSGAKSAGTLRVVLATDQPQLTSKLLVTPDANSAVNVAQFAGTNASTGTGAGGAGIPRVTISNDSSLAANQSTNVNQFGGSAVATGTGASGAGVPRVTIANDSALAANQSVNVNQWGGSATTLGQKAMTASVPVVQASDWVDPDTVGSTTALNALNAACSVALAGRAGGGMSLAAGTLIGTITPEISYDGGTTYIATLFFDATRNTTYPSVVFGSSNTAQYLTIMAGNGVTHERVRVSAFTSGTANCTMRATQSDAQIVVNTAIDGKKATYYAFKNFTCVAGDVAVLPGSATKTIRVLAVDFNTLTSGTAAAATFALIKRSTADTAGTSAAMTITPFDSNNVAVSSAPLNYTAAPTLGTAVGTVYQVQIWEGALSATLTTYPLIKWQLGAEPGGQEIVLRGIAQQLALNLSAAVATETCNVGIKWTEE